MVARVEVSAGLGSLHGSCASRYRTDSQDFEVV